MSNGYQREVVDFLKDYGALQIEVVPGGKHPKVEFDFRGKHRTYTIAATPSDHRASANTIADLKRMLGAPEVEEEPESRRLSDMLPEAPDRPTYGGAMAQYRNGKNMRLRFIFPHALVEQLSLAPWRSLDISALDKDTWHLVPLSPNLQPRRGQPSCRLDAKQLIVDTTWLTYGDEPFGVSPADFSVVGDAIVAHLHTDKLAAVKGPGPATAKKGWETRRVAAAQPAAEPPPQAVEVTAPREIDEPVTQRLRALLAMIGSAERQTGYRLVKARPAEGAEAIWMWRAPDIRL